MSNKISNKTHAINLLTGKGSNLKVPAMILDPSEMWENSYQIIMSEENISHIAINFLTFTDGRGYSLAARIKEKKLIKYVHAIGEINEELSYFLKRSGFDIAHFPIKGQLNRVEGMTKRLKKILNPFSDHYQVGNDVGI